MTFQWSQVAAPLLLLFGTLLSGVLPIWLATRLTAARHGNKLFAFLVCFGGGVLFATSFLHLLPEVREGFEKLSTEFPVTEGVVCLGFLAVYALEEIVHACLGHSHTSPTHGHSHSASVMNCGDQDQGRPPTPAENGADNKPHTSLSVLSSEELPAQRVSMGSVLIVVALSFHSVFEGLSLGLQETDKDTWVMFLAISVHKFVLSFVVGFDLTASQLKRCTIFIYMGVFSVMSPLGALVGAVTKNNLEGSPVVAGLNGVATGTLLYVTFFEVLQREKNSQLSGMMQLLAVLLGFAVMLVLVLVLPHD